MAMFMDTMTNQTAALTQPSVMRSMVMPNDVLLHSADRMEKKATNCSSRPSSYRFAGLISKTWFPKPR